MSSDKWEDLGQIVASNYRRKVLLVLYMTPMTPTEISKKTGILIAHVSRALRELVIKEVVNCRTPDRKKGRVYVITEKGMEIAEIIRKKQQ